MIWTFGTRRGDRRAEAAGRTRFGGGRVGALAAIALVGVWWLGPGAGVPFAWVARAMAEAQAGPTGPQVTLAWRDADGQAQAATIDQAKFSAFLERQKKAAEQESYQARTAANETLDRETTTVFASVRARVPHYADWYFRYLTKYELMSEAARSALRHITYETRSPRHEQDFIHSVESSLSEYLERQFSVRVLVPGRTQSEIEAAYDRTLKTTQAQWRAFTDDQDRQLVDFIKREGTPVAAMTALGIGRSDRAPPAPLLSTQHHEDVLDTYTFRRGLLQIRLQRARAASTKHPAAAQASQEEDEESGGDKTTAVLVDMFSKIVDPMASRLGDVVVGATAGGVAGAMAGGSSLTIMGVSGAATGAASIVPLTALFGVGVSLASDWAANKFEESLDRPSFEKNLADAVAATEDSIKKALIASLSEHIDALRDDMLANTAIDRLVTQQ